MNNSNHRRLIQKQDESAKKKQQQQRNTKVPSTTTTAAATGNNRSGNNATTTTTTNFLSGGHATATSSTIRWVFQLFIIVRGEFPVKKSEHTGSMLGRETTRERRIIKRASLATENQSFCLVKPLRMHHHPFHTYLSSSWSFSREKKRVPLRAWIWVVHGACFPNAHQIYSSYGTFITVTHHSLLLFLHYIYLLMQSYHYYREEPSVSRPAFM